jgi:Zn-dependent alcohol dehydrogenase
VVVLGAGGVGMNIIQLCRAFGANRIIAVDICDEKLKFAQEKMGATHVINAKKVMEEAGGDGREIRLIILFKRWKSLEMEIIVHRNL